MAKTFVITGAGSGIGRATAHMLAESSDLRLILVGRQLSHLEETKSKLKNSSNHLCWGFDVRNQDEWSSSLQKLDLEEYQIQGVFANAGIGGENHYGDADRWEEILSINLTGTYITIRELIPYLKKSTSEFKHIVITSSCLARFGVSKYTAYCTAKTGLLGLTKSLAIELAQDKILVNAICPGWVETDMAKAGIQKLADLNGQSYEDGFTEQMSFVPLNRISQPEEIGRFVRFLFSGEQTSITGQALDINNGSFMI